MIAALAPEDFHLSLLVCLGPEEEAEQVDDSRVDQMQEEP